jgi:hypothetical protein
MSSGFRNLWFRLFERRAGYQPALDCGIENLGGMGESAINSRYTTDLRIERNIFSIANLEARNVPRTERAEALSTVGIAGGIRTFGTTHTTSPVLPR